MKEIRDKIGLKENINILPSFNLILMRSLYLIFWIHFQF